uniref:Uncharacterized protein n=1 Tax=Rhizophora mucronata TaxID=61149 RepID=A0A2P2QLY2_RHIMU
MLESKSDSPHSLALWLIAWGRCSSGSRSLL